MCKLLLPRGSAAAAPLRKGAGGQVRLGEHRHHATQLNTSNKRPPAIGRHPLGRQLGSTVAAAAATTATSWWAGSPTAESGKDKVLVAVESACSLVHLQVIVSQYEAHFQTRHWLTAVQRLPDLISADGEFESFTQIQRLLLSFESRTFSALNSFSARQLVSVITTCAQLSYTPSSRWMSFAVAALLPRLAEVVVNPDQLCALLSALAKLGYSDCSCWQQMYTASLEAVPRLTSKQIAHLAGALATISCDNSTLITALSTRVTQDLAHLSSQEIAELATAFSNLGSASEEFWDAVGREAATRMSSLTPKEVACLVKAFAVANMRHPLLLDTVGQTVLSDLRQSSQAAYDTWRTYGVKELGDILWAFTRLQVHHVPLLTAIVRYVGGKTASISPALVCNQELKRWITFVRKQHSDFFMYGFFLSLATGVAMDQMVGATISFMAAWWLVLRPLITDAAATAYVQFLTRGGGSRGSIWGSILFNVEDVMRPSLRDLSRS